MAIDLTNLSKRFYWKGSITPVNSIGDPAIVQLTPVIPWTTSAYRLTSSYIPYSSDVYSENSSIFGTSITTFSDLVLYQSNIYLEGTIDKGKSGTDVVGYRFFNNGSSFNEVSISGYNNTNEYFFLNFINTPFYVNEPIFINFSYALGLIFEIPNLTFINYSSVSDYINVTKNLPETHPDRLLEVEWGVFQDVAIIPTPVVGTGGSIIIKKVTSDPPIEPSTPTRAEFDSTGIIVSGTSTNSFNYTDLELNKLNTLYYYLCDHAGNIDMVDYISIYVSGDPPYPTSNGGSLLVTPFQTPPTITEFETFGFSVPSNIYDPNSYITDPFVYEPVNLEMNKLYLHLMDYARNISTVDFEEFYVDLSPPDVVYQAPTYSAPYTANWISVNLRGAKNGLIDITDDRSGIIEEYFHYTTSSTYIAPITYTPAVGIFNSISGYFGVVESMNITFDFVDRQDFVSNVSVLPNDSLYYFHYSVRDKAHNPTIPITIEFRVDHDYPLLANTHYANDLLYLCDDQVSILYHTTDLTSGVVDYELTENNVPAFATPNVNTPNLFGTAVISPNEHWVNEFYPFQQTGGIVPPGPKTVYTHTVDQANNITTDSFLVYRSSQTILWHQFYAQRSTISPFLIDGNYEVQIIPNTPKLIAGFYVTLQKYYSPTPPDFDTYTGVTDYVLNQKFQTMSFLQTEDDVHGYIITTLNPTPPEHYSKKTYPITPVDFSGSTFCPPSITIKEKNDNTDTISLLNYYKFTANSGSITNASGIDYTNGDLITAYKLSEIPISTANTPPTYNSYTRKFEDLSGEGWTLLNTPKTFLNIASEPFTFTDPSYGTKTIYLWIATAAFSGLFSSPGTAATCTTDPLVTGFQSQYSLNYIIDNTGPFATNVTVNGNPTTVTGILPNQTHTCGTPTVNDIISISGNLTDAETEVVRWIISSSSTPPYFNQYLPNNWNLVSPPAATTSFAQSITLSAPNGTKAVYLHAVDTMGNHSINKILVNLNNPAYVPPSYGLPTSSIANTIILKFEGKSSEHVNRRTISSVFGDGVRQTGFISKQTPYVQSHRVHKLSEYRGLRVENTISHVLETLPPTPDPIKFSNFRYHIPRMKDHKITALPNIPNHQNTSTDLVLMMDIDTGDNISAYEQPFNNDLIDTESYWMITYIPTTGGAGSLVYNGFCDFSTGKITYNFPNDGIYFVSATSSYGYITTTIYTIYKTGMPVPPTQTPADTAANILIGSAGTTTVQMKFFIDSLSLACDFGILLDRTSSYVPSFMNQLYIAMNNSSPSLFDKLKEFSNNQITNIDDTNIAIGGFGGSGKLYVGNDWTSSTTTVISSISSWVSGALNSVSPKLMAVSELAKETFVESDNPTKIISPFRENCLKFIFLFADEPDQSNTSYLTPTTSDYYVDNLVLNNIAFTLFDSDEAIYINPSTGANTFLQDDLNLAVTSTTPTGGTLEILSKNSTATEIINSIESVLNKYRNSVTYNIEFNYPGVPFLISASPNSGSHTTPTLPVQYHDLYANTSFVPDRKELVVDLVLDNSIINTLGSNSITTFVTVVNSSGVPIVRKQLNIHRVYI